jgi:hypothetical protein
VGLVVEGHHLPDGGVALARAQGIPCHLHPVVPQPGSIVQALEDVYHGLDGHARGDRGLHPSPRGQALQPEGLEASRPVVDHRRLDGAELGHPPRAKAHLQAFANAPASLFWGGVVVVGPKAEAYVVGP